MSGFSRSTKISFILVFSFLFSGISLLQLGVEGLGINYGQLADNLPSPDKVLSLFTSLKIKRARIYDTNPQVLKAFAKSGIDLIVTVPNEVVNQLIDPKQALQWVSTNIQPYFPATNITGIAVGNEVYTSNDATLMMNLVPAMANIYDSLERLDLASYIHVSMANSLAVLADSYPPSAGAFRGDLSAIMAQFLAFLANTRSPFWINAYPYFAYKDDHKRVDLDYVLFNTNSGMIDPFTGLHYNNMLYAQVDAVRFAIARMGHDGLEVGVSETGWPSMGDPDEVGATLQNAQIYNRNLMRRQEVNEGTPLKPNQRLEVYVFALFNEDMKPGPMSERNYGLFKPDGTMAYNVGLTELPSSTGTASLSLTSSSTKATSNGFGSLAYWIFVYLTFQVLTRWPL